ncbi:hypothetical protein, partial [Pseudomonas syringae group genomosp. 7]|uniref:hypothetical protein n=1 Tax=Pseudomonas syringae group genomosp. 7 TaxID=251699 RepID=UPI00376FCDD9
FFLVMCALCFSVVWMFLCWWWVWRLCWFGCGVVVVVVGGCCGFCGVCVRVGGCVGGWVVVGLGVVWLWVGLWVLGFLGLVFGALILCGGLY